MAHKLVCEPWSWPGNRRLFKARRSGWSLVHHGHYGYLPLQWAAQDCQLHASNPSGYLCFAEVKAEGKPRPQGNMAGDACDKPLGQLLPLEHPSALSSTVRFSVPHS